MQRLKQKHVIWEYPLEMRDRQIVALPRNAQILTCQIQNDNLVMWVLLDPNEAEKEAHIIYYIGI